jgi:hypothetical protein
MTLQRMKFLVCGLRSDRHQCDEEHSAIVICQYPTTMAAAKKKVIGEIQGY